MVPRRAYLYNRDQGHTVTKFDPCAVSMLLELLRESGAKIVISSTWRLKGYDRVVELLSDNGIGSGFLHEDWRTSMNGSLSRGEQVQGWLDSHPEVTHYVAIDDGTVEVDNFVWCSNQDGLLVDHFRQMAEFLGIL